LQAFSRRTSGGSGRRPRSRVPLARRFTYRYLIALGLIAALALLGKLSVDSTGQKINDASRQLKQAIGQPVLVDEIESLATSLTNQRDGTGAGATDDDINNTASTLKQKSIQLGQVQLGLVQGDAKLDLPTVPLTPELNALYNEPDRLAQNVKDIATAGSNMADLPNNPANDRTRSESLDLIRGRVPEVKRDQQKAVQLYAGVGGAEVKQQQTDTQLLLGVTLLVGVGMFFGLFNPMARSIHSETTQLEEAERIHRENNERQTYRNDLSQALETTQSEGEVLAAVGRAFLTIIPDNKAELLLANSSRTKLKRAQINLARGAAGCPVDSPNGCAAMRRGQSVVYESSRMLNVCPKLPEHEQSVCSAVCTPVMFDGRAFGVLHAVGLDGHPPSPTEIERLAVLASETGNRLGILATTKNTELQATTDGLTGIFNRRALEDTAHRYRLDGLPFSLAIADLDNFKMLNDTHGHEAGDKALRLFASVLRSSLRPEDDCGRFGGEEFVVLLPGTGIDEATGALERLQVALAEALTTSDVAPFTASWGLTDSTAGPTFDDVVAVADGALYQAKAQGRNRIVTALEAPATAAAASRPADGPLIEIDMTMLQAGRTPESAGDHRAAGSRGQSRRHAVTPSRRHAVTRA
jgi:diguanylate cyclase (GGDEF)-like protein